MLDQIPVGSQWSGDCDKEMMGVTAEGKILYDLLGTGARRLPKPPQELCYRDGDEMGDWIWRRGERGEELQLPYLFF